MTPSPLNILILGGGLAGIAAAVRLSQSGHKVTLIETRLKLGGRATSFVDPQSGSTLDNCQHVLMGCCTNLIDLYERLGVMDLIEWHTGFNFLDTRQDGSVVMDVLEGDDLPAPFHMTRSMIPFKSLSWAEKFAIARGMNTILKMGRTGREKLYNTSFADWLAQQNQPAGAIQKFWFSVAVSAINEIPERLAAAYAIQVFQDGFLNNPDSYKMGLARVPLLKLYDQAQAVIKQAGGQLLLSRSVEKILFDGERVTGVQLDENQTLPADAIVSALPFDRLAKVATDDMVRVDSRLQNLDKFDVSPIIGIHLWLTDANGKPVTDLPHMVYMRSPLQWVFNKGWDTEQNAQHLHAVVSAAHDMVDKPAEQIARLAVAEIQRHAPNIPNIQLKHHRVVKEKRATFSARPGIESIRPTAAGAIDNLYLAGDWTRSGWPATMEGAARSGYLAAQAVLEAHPTAHHTPGQSLLSPDLPDAPIFTLLAGL
jgi:hydroxysqualene dehydroxylase